VLANYGIILQGIQHDTLLQSYVLESHRSHGMDDLAMRHLNIQTTPYEAVAGKGAKQISFSQVTIDIASTYAAEDADITLRLHQTLYPQLENDAQLKRIYHDIEIPVSNVLFKMERHGVLLDRDMLNQQS